MEASAKSPLEVSTAGFTAAGRLLAGLGLPTVLVHEGGYDLDRLGPDTVAVLGAFVPRPGMSGLLAGEAPSGRG